MYDVGSSLLAGGMYVGGYTACMADSDGRDVHRYERYSQISGG